MTLTSPIFFLSISYDVKIPTMQSDLMMSGREVRKEKENRKRKKSEKSIKEKSMLKNRHTHIHI